MGFARDRLAESVFWAIGMASQPQLGNFRREMTILIVLITIIDYIYDAYGTLEELELFTKAIDRSAFSSILNLSSIIFSN